MNRVLVKEKRRNTVRLHGPVTPDKIAQFVKVVRNNSSSNPHRQTWLFPGVLVSPTIAIKHLDES